MAAGGSEEEFVPTILHLHNGYMSVMMYGGIFAFVLFILIIIDKVFEARSLRYFEQGTGVRRKESIVVAALVIYFLVINLVEPYFTGRRHIEFLLMMILLAWNKYKTEEDVDDTDGKLSHKTE